MDLSKYLLSGNIGKAAPMTLSTAEKMAVPAAVGLAGLGEAYLPFLKYGEENPTAGTKEKLLSPEVVKGMGRGAGQMVGMMAGTKLGGMSPILKTSSLVAGGVAGLMAGGKLGEMLTGIPAVDALITKAYEKQLREREAKMMAETESSSYLKNPRMADAAPRNMELRSGQ
jgi:hypothetical protein